MSALLAAPERSFFAGGRFAVRLRTRTVRSDTDIFLYDRDRNRVHGPFRSDRIRREKNGCTITLRRSAFRRSAFHLIDIPECSTTNLSEAYAGMLLRKLAAVNSGPHAVLSVSKHGRSLALTYIEHAPDTRILDASVSLPNALARALLAAYRRMYDSPAGTSRDAAALGASFYAAIISGTAIARHLGHARTLTIDADRTTGAYPWELMHDGSFLAERMLIGFMPRGEQRPRPTRTTSSCTVIIGNALAHAENEAESVYAIASRCPGVAVSAVSDITPLAFSAVLGSNDIVHVVSHGTGASLALKKPYTVHDIAAAASMPAVVFLHTCTAAPVNAADPRHLAPNLVRMGAGAVIASMGAVSDAYDTRFISEFYASIFAGETAGTAFRNALIMSGGAALRYRFFGTPGTRL